MKIKTIDENGNLVEFDHSIDASQAVATGRYFYPGNEPKVVKHKIETIEPIVELNEEADEVEEQDDEIQKPKRGRKPKVQNIE